MQSRNTAEFSWLQRDTLLCTTQGNTLDHDLILHLYFPLLSVKGRARKYSKTSEFLPSVLLIPRVSFYIE